MNKKRFLMIAALVALIFGSLFAVTSVGAQDGCTAKATTTVNIRTEAGATGEATKLGQLHRGDLAQILETTQAGGKDWYKIQMDDGTYGWIASWLTTNSCKQAAVTASAGSSAANVYCMIPLEAGYGNRIQTVVLNTDGSEYSRHTSRNGVVKISAPTFDTGYSYQFVLDGNVDHNGTVTIHSDGSGCTIS